MTGFAAYGSLRHVGRAVLLALVVFPVIWVLFIASGTSFGPAIALGELQVAGRDPAVVIGAALALERDGGVR